MRHRGDSPQPRQDLHQRDRAAPPARSTRFRTRAQSCRRTGRRGQAQGSRDTTDPEAEDAHDGTTVVAEAGRGPTRGDDPGPVGRRSRGRDHQHPGACTSRRSRLRTPHGGGPATGPGCSPACSCCWPSAAPACWAWTTRRTGQRPARLPCDRHRRRRGPLGDAHRQHPAGDQPAGSVLTIHNSSGTRALRPRRRPAAGRHRRRTRAAQVGAAAAPRQPHLGGAPPPRHQRGRARPGRAALPRDRPPQVRRAHTPASTADELRARPVPERASARSARRSTPARMNRPPTSWIGRGSSPSRIHANRTANITSERPTNEASFAPSTRVATIPVTYAVAAAIGGQLHAPRPTRAG